MGAAQGLVEIMVWLEDEVGDPARRHVGWGAGVHAHAADHGVVAGVVDEVVDGGAVAELVPAVAEEPGVEPVGLWGVAGDVLDPAERAGGAGGEGPSGAGWASPMVVPVASSMRTLAPMLGTMWGWGSSTVPPSRWTCVLVAARSVVAR
ncbi:hypothetical protein OG738_21955 [Amycolatopsis sp. NBC_01488]|nr:hypothetical protein [Amycolatopsis sp. NBC_01488]